MEGGTFLIGINGYLFKVQNEFSVLTNYEPFYAVGSGEIAAMAVLSYVIDNEKVFDPTNLIKNALETASKLVTTVSPPFVIEKCKPLHQKKRK